MKKILLLVSVLLFLAGTGMTHAQERITDYFYPDGRSSYLIYKGDKDNSQPVEKISVRFESTSRWGRMDEYPPIPLIGNIMYQSLMETTCYSLDISDTAVTAHSWWKESGTPKSRGNVYHNLVLLKLPADKETLNWTTSVNKDGTVLQIWEMSARRVLMPAEENGSWIAVHALEVKRNVFDAEHNPIPRENVIEYWRQGKGKVKVVRNI